MCDVKYENVGSEWCEWYDGAKWCHDADEPKQWWLMMNEYDDGSVRITIEYQSLKSINTYVSTTPQL